MVGCFLRAIARPLLALSLCLAPLSAFGQAGCVSGISNADVFGYAEATFAGLFPQTPTSGTYQQYSYRYYAGTQAYLGIDTQCNIVLYGAPTAWTMVPVGPVAAFAAAILAWRTASAGGTPCTYRVSPATLAFGGSGGTGTVNVLQNEIACTVANPPWAITSGAAWITHLQPGSLSNGQGPAYFYVEPNGTANARQGVVTIAGNQVTVTQSAGATSLAGTYSGRWQGSCTYFGAVSGTFSVTITAQGGVSGQYVGDDDGGFAGTVDAAGTLNTAAGVAGGGAYWTGTIVAGGAGSFGSWTDAGCSGGWTIP